MVICEDERIDFATKFFDKLFKFLGEEYGFSYFTRWIDEKDGELCFVIDETFAFNLDKFLKNAQKLLKVMEEVNKDETR